MSTPDQPTGPREEPGRPDDQPQYGQRSPGWAPESPQQGGSGAGAAPSSSQTPWPQYGQTSHPSPGAPWPQAGQPSGGGYPPAGPPSAPAVALPSRAGSIATLVAGAVLMVVIAPIVFFSVMFGGMNISDLMSSAATVQSGDTVQVDESGTYIVTSLDDASLSCTLTGQDGTVLQLQNAAGESTVAMGSGIPAGSYTLDCGASSTSMVGMTGASVDSVAHASIQAVLWATVIGIVGLVALIVGIVMLVQVNRRRRDLQRQAWGAAPPLY